MPKKITIKKGLDIPLKGMAIHQIEDSKSSLFSIKPTDFIGVSPKLLVKIGDVVHVGSPLFYSKSNELIKFTSPVSGSILDIKRGEKRVIQEIIIKKEGSNKQFEALSPAWDSKETAISSLLESGLWPMIRQRPYHIIANPGDSPKAIFISGFDSSPLAPDYEYLTKDKTDAIQVAINVISKFTTGQIYLSLRDETSHLNKLANLNINYFKGPHPSGNVGTQIHHINPINKGETVWTINLLDLIILGNYISTGILDFSKTIALSGPSVKEPKYYQITAGESIESIVSNNLNDDNSRFISGNVLTGTKIDKSGFLSFYDHQLTVIPEGDYYEFMGWIAPGFDKYSLSRTFFSWLTPKKKYTLDTNYHGELRNFVVTGQYEKVFPWDIMPVQLLKAIIIKDIEMMENLGIYEVAEEDFALCEYVCTSKIESQQLIRTGIELIQKEMS